MGNGQWVTEQVARTLFLPPPELRNGQTAVTPDPAGNRAARRAAKRQKRAAAQRATGGPGA